MNNPKNNYLNFTKKIAMFVITICLALTLFACADPETQPPAWATEYALPSEESVNSKLLEIYGSQEKTYLLNNTIQRMPCPENGATMTFNMRYEVDEYAKIVLEDAVNEINEIFKVINPNYKFAINYTPKQEDFDSKYSIKMNIIDNFSSPTIMGTAQMSTGKYLSNFGITLKNTTLDDLRYLMLTFRHEFMHLLGAGDAYENPLAEKTTVMQNYNNTKYRNFSSSDVAFIDAYYRNPKNPNSNEFIKNYIDEYEENNTHTQNALLSKCIHYAMQNSSSSILIEQLQNKHYKNTQELVSILQKGLKINTNFGKNNINFKELSYQEGYEPEKNYFGSFDVSAKKYWHGMGMGSMGISYTDFSGGILFAMPNGSANMTLFIQADNYVLTFHIDGLFLSSDYTYAVTFSEINISLLHACTIN